MVVNERTYPITIKVHADDLQAVKKKYQQLCREIENGNSIMDMEHTVSKLGIFIENILGDAWREVKSNEKCE